MRCSLHICMYVCMYVCMNEWIKAWPGRCYWVLLGDGGTSSWHLLIALEFSLPAYIHTYIHIYIHTYIQYRSARIGVSPYYIHTYIQYIPKILKISNADAYIHTHTYIHTHRANRVHKKKKKYWHTYIRTWGVCAEIGFCVVVK